MPANPEYPTGTYLIATPATIPTWWWWTGGAVALLVAAATATLLHRHRHRRATNTATATAGATDADPDRAPRVMYIVALLATGVSSDTSWRFFGQVLDITGWEQAAMFAVLEIAMIACGIVMRSNARRGDPPGQARTFLWVLTAGAILAAYMLSGVLIGIARVFFGPVVGIWALHIALGLDMRHAKPTHTGTWQRVTAELRERALSRLGLGDERRDALALRQDRAARRAADLAIRLDNPKLTTRESKRLIGRLRRAVSTSNVAHDPRRRAVLLAELAVLGHVNELIGMRQESPWTTGPAAPAAATRPTAARRAPRPATNGHALPLPAATAIAASATESATGTDATRPTATQSTTSATQPATDTTPTTDTGTALVTDDTATDTSTPDTSTPATAEIPATPPTTTNPANPTTKVGTMREMFDHYVREGRVHELTAADMARHAGASSQLGRKYLPQWRAELQPTTTATETDPR